MVQLYIKFVCIEVITILYEHTLSVDEFNNPKVLKNGEAMANILARLLLLEPGTFETHPEMGVGIVSRYRYSFAGHADELESDFKAQIEKYLPTFQGVQVKVEERDNMYYITATINNDLFGIVIDSNLSIQTVYKQLSDLNG